MSDEPLKIAVIGSGVAGLTAAYLLNKKHAVTLIEKEDRIGGHTRTLTLPEGPDAGLAVDTGFIVMNLRNYPNFTRLLNELDVAIQESCMTFSYHDAENNYGYAGTSLRGILPDLSYLFKRRHIALVADLIRFAFIGYKDLKSGYLEGKTLGEYLDARKFRVRVPKQLPLSYGGSDLVFSHAKDARFSGGALSTFFRKSWTIKADQSSPVAHSQRRKP
jgi:predicted NAD/FAD-binding protein